MNNLLDTFVENNMQCWSCPIFDRLFQIVSEAASAVYNQFVILCAILFCVLFAFFVINAVWQNFKNDQKDPLYQKSIKPVIINSLFALTFLSMGVYLPRFITTITFEPAAEIALIYSQSILRTDNQKVNKLVHYKQNEISESGFYRPQLRDTIIMLMKTTITQFQSYIKLGISVMDKAFSLSALKSISAFIKHITLFLIGLYLAYAFFKLFLKFCFYFVDIIVAMTFFAFFFPLSLMLVSFKGADSLPSWISSLGKNIGTKQFKDLINAIITLAVAVLTYTVITVIISKFFLPGQSVEEIMTMITSGDIFAIDLSEENLFDYTLVECIILVYVLNFIYDQIPNVTSMVLQTFGVSEKKEMGEELANSAMQLTKSTVNLTVKVGQSILTSKDSGKDDTKDKKEEDNK